MQEKYLDLSKIVCPLVVPLIEQRKKIVIDTDSQNHHLWNLSQIEGISIFLGSNAGESRVMDFKNLKKSIKSGLDFLSSDFPQTSRLVGVLREDINEVIELAKFAEKNGAQAIVFAPIYNQENPNKIRDTLLKSTSLPLIIYNNPDFRKDKQNISLDFITESTKIKQIIGIKDTSRQPEYFAKLLQLRTPNFHVLQADTKAGLDDSIEKCDGMVAIEANLFPQDLITRWNYPDNSIHCLLAVMDFYCQNKNTFSGSIGLTKEILYRSGIFRTPLMYPKTG